MRSVAVTILAGFCLGSCSHAPQKYEVYDSILQPDTKAQVEYVGANWEYKNKVEAKEIKDEYDFIHTLEFWSYSPDTKIVIFKEYELGEYCGKRYCPLEQFVKE